MLKHATSLLIVLLLAATSAAQEKKAKQSTRNGQIRNVTNYYPHAADEVLPDPVVDLIERGDRLAGAKRFDEAIAQYEAAIKKAGRPVFTAYLNIGNVHFQKNDYNAAAQAYRQAIAIKPENWQAHYNLAEALYSAGDYRAAEAAYRKVISLSPGGVIARAHHFLGLSLYGQNRIDEAIAEYRTAVEKAKGDYSEAHYNLGIALLAKGDATAAEREFQLAIEQEKKDWPEAHFNLAQALEKQKRLREAADEYEIYLRLAPSAPDAARLREYIAYLRRKQTTRPASGFPDR